VRVAAGCPSPRRWRPRDAAAGASGPGDRPLMSLPVRIALTALRRPERHAYGGDASQVADLHLPPGHGPHPVVVVLHGGHWRTGFGKLVTRRSRSTWPGGVVRRGTSSTAGSAGAAVGR